MTVVVHEQLCFVNVGRYERVVSIEESDSCTTLMIRRGPVSSLLLKVVMKRKTNGSSPIEHRFEIPDRPLSREQPRSP